MCSVNTPLEIRYWLNLNNFQTSIYSRDYLEHINFKNLDFINGRVEILLVASCLMKCKISADLMGYLAGLYCCMQNLGSYNWVFIPFYFS